MTPEAEQRILARLDELHAEIGHVKALATATNGRLRTIELWKARVDGVLLAVKTVPALLTVIATGASIVAVIVAFSS